VVVQFTVSPMRRVWNVRGQPIRSSGNGEFDESVRAALESAIDEQATVPAPPHELVGEHFGYRVEFTEGDPHICRQPTLIGDVVANRRRNRSPPRRSAPQTTGKAPRSSGQRVIAARLEKVSLCIE
jgi:hypothetical protein